MAGDISTSESKPGIYSRREFLKMAGIGIASLAFPRLHREPSRSEEIVSNNIDFVGANSFNLDGKDYQILANREPVAKILLSVAKIIGGNGAVDKSEEWLKKNRLRVFISPLLNIYSIAAMPWAIDSEKTAEGRIFWNQMQKTNLTERKLQKPDFLENKGANRGAFNSGAFYPPEETTDGTTTVVLSAGVMWDILFRGEAKRNNQFAQKYQDLLTFPFDNFNVILAHELWHLERYILHPEQELNLAGKICIPEDNRSFQTPITLNNLETILKADEIHIPYPKTFHPQPEMNIVENAFRQQPNLVQLQLETFSFKPLNQP